MPETSCTTMTNLWIKASLIINIVVLIPVCILMARDRFETVRVFGPQSTARQILLCMYLAILAASIAAMSKATWTIAIAVPMLAMQVFYKTLSVVIITDKSTPVLWFNLAIAVFHARTLYLEGRFFVAP